jgi:hypothetical protein
MRGMGRVRSRSNILAEADESLKRDRMDASLFIRNCRIWALATGAERISNQTFDLN